jgi:PAS domain S-box-containing protein
VSAEKNHIFEEELGKEYRSIVFPVTDEALAIFFEGKLIPVHHSFHDFTFGQFPRDACTRVEKRLGEPTFHTIGLTWSGNVFGNVNIILPKGEPLADVALVEAFMRQASLALRKNLAEQGLSESEEKYRVLAENSLDGIAITDRSGTIIYANRAVEHMLIPEGSGPLIGKNLVSYLDSSDRHGLQEKISALSGENPSFAGIYHLANHGGEERWLECIVTRIEYRHAPMASFALRDTTEMRRAERELLVKERAMQASINGMAIIDPGQRLIYANPSFCSILDFSPEDLLGKEATILARDSEELLSLSRQISETLVRDGRWFGEARSQKKDGSYVYLMVSVTHVKDESGDPICTLLAIVDVSDRMHFEEAFRTTYEKLRETIEFIPDPTFVIDCDRRIVAWNSALAGLTGVSREQMLGKTSYAEAFPFFRGIRPILVDLIRLPAYEVSHLYPGVRRFGNNIFIETFVPTLRHGRGAFLWGKATPLIDNEGKCIGAIESIRDITEWKRAEEALRRGKKAPQDPCRTRRYPARESGTIFCDGSLAVCRKTGTWRAVCRYLSATFQVSMLPVRYPSRSRVIWVKPIFFSACTMSSRCAKARSMSAEGTSIRAIVPWDRTRTDGKPQPTSSVSADSIAWRRSVVISLP